MLVSLKWLKDYVDLPDSLTPKELALKLTMSTVEIEGFTEQAKQLENIVVGYVNKCEKHPQADKLLVCEVNSGSENLQVVCGGTNVKEGMKVAFAPVGARVKWHGEGELVELKELKIRGVLSQGMICAANEIGLNYLFPNEKEGEILDLSFLDVDIGISLSKALGLDDVIFDIDNKSMNHRPDLWGHYGLAREVAAIYKKKLFDYSVENIKEPKEFEFDLQVEIEDHEYCPRYMAVVIDNVKIEPSPLWLQKRLIAVGLKPINNIVDITNYILYDLGQPMHAFDAEKIKGFKEKKIQIKVRKAKNNELITTLDGQKLKLDNDVLVIADSQKPIALAGIMGGLESEITNQTKTIIFESANFLDYNIRKSSVKLKIRTDSSARFEKNQDPYNAELALKKAIELTMKLCPDAKIVSKVIDKTDFYLYQGPIELSLNYIKNKIGLEIEKKQIIDILTSLGFEVKVKKDILMVKIPSWRATKDISLPIDLVEEIARIYGYDNIQTKLPSFTINPPEINKLKKLERRIRNILVLGADYFENYNYSFVAPHLVEKLGLNQEDYIELLNPIAKDRPLLRRCLAVGLLENVLNNAHVDRIKIVEFGKIFLKEEAGQRLKINSDELLPKQDLIVGFVYTNKNDETPFYTLSADLKLVLDILQIDYELEKIDYIPYLHPGRQAFIRITEEKVGYIGELSPITQKKIGLDKRVGIVELNLNKLLGYINNDLSYYKGLNQYPSIKRDLAIVIDKNISQKQVVDLIKSASDLVVDVELFDVYEGKELGLNKKSLAYHLIYQAQDRTLTTEETEKEHQEIIKILAQKFNAKIR